MVPLKRGESLQQMMRFFNSLSILIALQIRWLLYSWMEEWLLVMSIYQMNKVSSVSDRLNNSVGKTTLTLRIFLNRIVTGLVEVVKFIH